MPAADSRPVLVTGATGYVGGRLVPELLEAGHKVRCLARTPSKLAGFDWAEEVEIAKGDVTDAASLDEAMAGTRAAFYLVHSMGGTDDFAEEDRRAAATFRDAAERAGLEQLIYLGGLGDEKDPHLSMHLRSRHEVGRVMADGPVPVTEVRAAVIIGSGSASFEMLRNLVDVLPVMVTPKWVRTRCQPVAIRDVLRWLVGVLETEDARGRVLEIGGPEVLTYEDMMRIYAEEANLRRRLIIRVPLLTPRLSSLWVGLVTPLPTSIAQPLVKGLSNEVVITDRPASAVVPVETMPFREAVRLALRRVEHLDVSTWWGNADREPLLAADPAPSDPGWAGGTLLRDDRQATSAASPDKVFAVLAGVGGKRGWYAADFLWEVRGLLDRAVGGIGLRRGRRHPDELRVGDALDFWRVDLYEPPRRLRLRAEMKLPGRAWLEWNVHPDGTGSRLEQSALYNPKGLSGRMYWYAMLPFHALIFGRMAARLAAAAESTSSDG